MAWWRRSRVAVVAAVALAAALALWTMLAPDPGTAWPVDRQPAPSGAWGQVLQSLAITTSTPVVFVALTALGAWTRRHRLFAVTGAMTLALALSWSGAVVLSGLIGRARPDSLHDHLITLSATSYPSVPVAVWTTTAIMVATLASTLRRSVWPWVVAGVVVVGAIATAQLALGAASATDVVAGVLLGGLAASLANLISDVHIVAWARRGGDRTAAVIYNPAKVVGIEIFHEIVGRTLRASGYGTPVWLTTSIEDPGVAMAREAIARDVDLVLVAGGDGTVRVVLGELAGSGIAAAILPSGTGNLLARNLAIPLDLDRAAQLAVSGLPRPTDIIEVALPDRTEYAAVLAGVGIDANIMGDTDEDLKKAIGPAAYVVAGARHIRANPLRVRLTLDDGEPVSADASLVSIGNVGDLQEGVTLMPDASAHDGRFDVLVATPHTTLDMAQMITGVLFEADDGPNIARYTGSKLRLEIDGGAMCQIDGDVVGEVTDVTFEVHPGAVQLVLPR